MDTASRIGPPWACPALPAALGAPSPQLRFQLALQLAAGVHVDRPVDRLVTDPHARVLRVRYELARLLECGHTQAQIARLMGRPGCTISRELARNRCRRTGRYVPERADRLAWERQRRPKPTKLSRQPALKARTQEMLDLRYSPQQVAGRLKREHPEDPSMWISHE